MHTAEVQLSLALLLLTIGEAFSSASSYQWTDQETGKVVTCQKCPPGTFVARHCTARSRTKCQPCPQQHYTSHQNYLEKCRYCNTICDNREQVKQECNATHNRVCECQPGYHRDFDSCVKNCNHSKDFDNPECDAAVVDFIVHFIAQQKPRKRIFHQLLHALYGLDDNGKKPLPSNRIRNELECFKRADPDHALLPQLLEAAEEAKLPELKSKLEQRFLSSD